MAINIESARFLLACVRAGVSFHRSLTLGRQGFHLSHRETRRVLREHGLDPGAFPRLFNASYPGYAEPFWEALGARHTETLDASDYEGATIVHDLNRPVPDALRGQFDAVCDAGTLEHVFNFPVALRNCLELVRPEGHFLGITPANNQAGHGFYQFSPELYFRALSPANGFQVQKLYAVEFGWRRRWFEVTDPQVAHARVAWLNRYPVLLFVRAKKVASVPLFERPPQQSDYVAQWSEPSARRPAPGAPLSSFRRRLLETMPGLCRRLEALLYSSLNRNFSLRNRASFRPVNPRRL